MLTSHSSSANFMAAAMPASPPPTIMTEGFAMMCFFSPGVGGELRFYGSATVYMPHSEAIPIVASTRPTPRARMLARFWALALVHTPHVMPDVHRPFAR